MEENGNFKKYKEIYQNNPVVFFFKAKLVSLFVSTGTKNGTQKKFRYQIHNITIEKIILQKFSFIIIIFL